MLIYDFECFSSDVILDRVRLSPIVGRTRLWIGMVIPPESDGYPTHPTRKNG